MSYCDPNDLLVGDIAGLDTMKVSFIQMATEEIDAMIGFVYVLPLPALTLHVALILKGICRKLASGRLICAQATANEDNTVHAYGQSLIEEAMRDLWAVRNGQIDLLVPKVPGSASSGDAPAIIQGDTISGVDAYYDWMNGRPGRTRAPWKVPSYLGPSEWQPGRYD